MKKSTKAALLSSLIFPGIGHLALKSYLRGLGLMSLSLIAFAYVVNVAYQRATLIVDRMYSGDIALDTGAIAAAAADAGVGTDNLAEKFFLLVLAGCWVIGIVDSYRLGAAQDKQGHDL
ncbi:MAG: hypothetical protein OEV58_02865 [Gammaproteobacteria bacterium]|nr:hypothetical protein [Gammaproteobacteria bacterium]